MKRALISRLLGLAVLVASASPARALFIGLPGDYGGVISAGGAGGDPKDSGIFTMLVTDRGRMTVQFVWQGVAYRTRGSFGDLETETTLSVPKRGAENTTIQIRLQIDTQPRMMKGELMEVVDGLPGLEFVFALSGEKPDAVAVERIGERRAGWVNVASFPGPGPVRITVGRSARKAGRFVGRLPDYEPFSAGSPLRGVSFFLRCGLYTQHHSPGGQLLGEALSSSMPGLEFTGTFDWHKQPNPAAPAFPSGFHFQALIYQTERYPTGAKLLPLGVPVATINATLELRDGNLPEAIDVPLNISRFGARVLPPNPHQAKLRIDVPGDRFSGSFLHPATGARVPFSGVFSVLPPESAQGEGRGCFLSIDTADASQSRAGSAAVVPMTPDI